MTKDDEIQERLINFADKIVTLCDTLPPTTSAEHIAAQLLRSAITPALKFIEAGLAETSAASIDNLRQAVIALIVSDLWLRSMIAGNILTPDTLAPLITDCQQLQRILIAGINYAGNPPNPDHHPPPTNHQLPDHQTTGLLDY